MIGLKETFGVAGLGVGMGILGDSLGSTGLQEGGQAATGFVSPMVNVSAGGYVVNMLGNLK